MKTTLFFLICFVILLNACRTRSDDNTGSEDSLSSYLKLSSESEPGECLTLEGKVVSGSKGTGVKGIKIFVYHTNKDGLYNENGAAIQE